MISESCSQLLYRGNRVAESDFHISEFLMYIFIVDFMYTKEIMMQILYAWRPSSASDGHKVPI